jgi:hypothetical protein
MRRCPDRVRSASVHGLFVYEVSGLQTLRTAWISLNRIWALVLIGSGMATLAVSL